MILHFQRTDNSLGFHPQAVVLEPEFFNTRRSNIVRKVILLSTRKLMIAYLQNHVVLKLCQKLNDTETIFPCTNLRMIFNTVSS